MGGDLSFRSRTSDRAKVAVAKRAGMTYMRTEVNRIVSTKMS